MGYFKGSLLGTSAFGTASLAAIMALGSLPAHAQESDPDEVSVQKTITVTGSRIAQDPNIISSVPVQSIGEDDFQLPGK